MSKCNCPNPTSLTTIPSNDCPINLKQIQKVGFQRQGYEFDASLVTPTSPSVQADWDVLIAAADDTKAVFSPLIGGDPIIEPGEAITEGGGDNSTLNGVEEVTGTNPASFSANFKEISPEQEAALKELICEKKLVVYFVNEDNNIIVKKIDDDKKTGFDIQSFFFGDRGNQGFGTKDINVMSFQLKAGWSEAIEIIEPEPGFNPLVDLV